MFERKYRRAIKLYNKVKGVPVEINNSGATESSIFDTTPEIVPPRHSQAVLGSWEKENTPMLKNFVKENEFLYRLWFVLIRSRQVKGRRRLPQATDHLFFTGFPRSGNTYLANLIVHCFPSLEFTHHLHTVGSIKIALSNNLETFVIIRNPLDSVGSFLAYHSDDLNSVPTEKQVRLFLSHYSRYFRFLNDKKDVLNFISFEKMIVDKKSSIGAIAKVLGLPDFELSDDLLKEYDRKMRKAETRKANNAGSFPNEQKQAYKAKVSKLILADAYFSQCSDLFDSLEASTINAVK